MALVTTRKEFVMRSLAVAVAIGLTSAAGADKKQEVKAKLEGHRGGVTAVAFAPKRAVLATASGSGAVKLWDANTGEQLAAFNNHEGQSITGLAFSVDGKRLAASARSNVIFWDVTDPKAAKLLRRAGGGPQDVYTDAAVAGDGTEFYFAEAQRPVKDPFPGSVRRERPTEPVGTGTILSYKQPRAFDPKALAGLPDPDARVVAAYALVGEKGTPPVPSVVLYGLGDPKVTAEKIPGPPKDGPVRLAYSPDAKWLGLCSGSFVVWNVPGSLLLSGEPIVVTEEAAAGALGPGGTAFTVGPADAAKEAEVTAWQLGDKPKNVGTIPTGLKDVRCLAVSPDGKTLAVGAFTDGLVRLVPVGGEKK